VTGKTIEAEIFVSVLGASSYLFARAVPDQTVGHFIGCVMRAFEFYGGCTEYLVPDNLKSAVTHPSYYEPDINRTFAAMAAMAAGRASAPSTSGCRDSPRS
jgi:transposase